MSAMTQRRVASPPILIQASDPDLRRAAERLSFRPKKLIADFPHVLGAPGTAHAAAAPPRSEMNSRRFMGIVLKPRIKP